MSRLPKKKNQNVNTTTQLSKCFHFYDRKDKTMRAISQSLKRGICEVMNLQGLRRKSVINGRDISKMYSIADLEQALEELEQTSNGVSSKFRQVLFECCILTIRAEAQIAYSLLAKFILDEFILWFGSEANGLVRDFIAEWKSHPIASEPKRLYLANRSRYDTLRQGANALRYVVHRDRFSFL